MASRFGGISVENKSRFGGIPVGGVDRTVKPLPDTPESRMPQWMKDSPTKAGLYGAGKGLIQEAVKPTLEFGAAVGAQIVAPFAPLVAPSIGYGIGKKTGEMIEHQYDLLENPNARSKTVAEEMIGSAIDVGTALAVGKGTDVFLRKVVGPADQKITQAITNTFKKGVKYSTANKGDASAVTAYLGKAENAVREIIKDESVAIPKTMEEFSQAIRDTKINTFKKYHNIAIKSGKEGLTVDLRPVISEMEAIGNSAQLRRVNASEADRLLKMAAEWKTHPTRVSPAQAETTISELNTMSKSWWNNPNLNDVHAAMNYERTASNVRKQLGKTLGDAGPEYQELKKVYGSLSTIEKDVTNRATTFGKRNPKGFFDLAGIHGTGKFVYGLAKMDPASMVSGAAIKGAVKYTKFVNNPDRMVKNMFRGAQRQMVKSGQIQPPKKGNPNYVEFDESIDFIGQDLRPKQGVYRYQPERTINKSPQPQQFESATTANPPTQRQGITPEQLSRSRGRIKLNPRDLRVQDIADDLASNPPEGPLRSPQPISPEGRGVGRVQRQESDLARQIRTTPKTKSKTGITPDSVKAYEMLNAHRKSKGLPPLSKFNFTKQRQHETRTALEKINEYRISKGLKPHDI